MLRRSIEITAKPGHSPPCGLMSAFGGKTDSQKGGLLRLLMTLNGSNYPPQSEALQPDPTNACGGPAPLRKADHVEKRDPRSDDNEHRKYGA